MRKRSCCRIGLLLLGGALLSGCQGVVKEPILQKKQAEGAETVAWNEGMTLKSQIQAPETFQMEKKDETGVLEVYADAVIEIPDAEGIKLKKVVPRRFTQEEEALLKEYVLGDTANTETEEQEGQVFQDGAEILDQEAESTALAEEYDENSYYTFYGNGRYYSFKNNLTETDVGVTCDFHREDMQGEDAGNSEKEADELVKKLGISHMQRVDQKYYVGESEEAWEAVYAYTRVVDGIPITYTTEDEGVPERAAFGSEIVENDVYWSKETLTLRYDSKGLEGFYWNNPYEIMEVSDEYVFLLPFSEVEEIFRQTILKESYAYVQDGMKAELHVTEAKLGYMRIRDRENPLEGTLTPVWDFFGRVTKKTYNEDYDIEQGIDHFLTINAMDGSIVDRSVPY